MSHGEMRLVGVDYTEIPYQGSIVCGEINLKLWQMDAEGSLRAQTGTLLLGERSHVSQR